MWRRMLDSMLLVPLGIVQVFLRPAHALRVQLPSARQRALGADPERIRGVGRQLLKEYKEGLIPSRHVRMSDRRHAAWVARLPADFRDLGVHSLYFAGEEQVMVFFFKHMDSCVAMRVFAEGVTGHSGRKLCEGVWFYES